MSRLPGTSAQAFYRSDPLNGFAIGNMVTWAAVLKKDDAMAERYENIMLEEMGFSVLGLYPSKRMHRVDQQTAIVDFKKMAPAWGLAPEIADTWVSAVYDPSGKQDALQEFRAWHDRGDLGDEMYWTSLLVLGEADEAGRYGVRIVWPERAESGDDLVRLSRRKGISRSPQVY